MANINGTTGADLLIGTLEDDIIDAINGNDSIFAGANNDSDDVMSGGSGDDIIGGGLGNDILVGDNHVGATILGDLGADGSNTLFGGAGDDLVITGSYNNSGTDATFATAGANALGGFVSGTGNSTAWLGDGNDIGYGGDGDDEIGGGAGDDQIFAGNGNNTVYLGAGNDVVVTGTGNDTIFGGAGDDDITAGAGDDQIFAGAGNNTVTGGAGADTFGNGVGNAGNTTITDFTLGEDVLGLQNFAADFADGAAVVAAMTDSADGAVLTLAAGQTVTFAGLTVADFNTTTENWVNLTGTAEGTPLTFELTPTSAAVDEGATQTFTVTTNRPVDADTDVVFTLVPGNGTGADQGTNGTNTNDFAQGAFNPTTVTIAAGTSTATFDVAPLNDAVTELPEGFTIQASVGGVSVGEVTGNVQDSTDPILTGQTFTLTAGSDTGADFTGTAANDTFEAFTVEASGGGLVDSLQNIDQLNGAGGVDTLTTVLQGGAAVTPGLESIENIALRSAVNGSGVNLSNSTGVQNVSVANSSGTAVVNNLGAVGALGVANQSQRVDFDDSTAATLALGLTNVGNTAATTVSLANATATTLNLTLTDNANDNGILPLNLFQNAGTATTINATLSGDNVMEFQNVGDAATALNVDGQGSLTVAAGSSFALLTDLNVTGGASVDLDGFTIGTLETVAAGGTTGDVAVQVGAAATAITTGSGNDSVTQTATLVADTVYDLGAGDDTYVVGANNDDDTASVEAGTGVDTLSMTAAIAGTVSADADIADNFTGFEVLSISEALPGGTTIDVSAFAGVNSFTAANGVAAAGTATVNGIGEGATVTLAGDLGTNNGTLDANLASTAGANSLNVVINGDINVVDDGNVDTTASTATVDTTGVETLNVESTGTLGADISEGNPLDVAANTLALTNDDLVTLNVSGDQAFNFATAASQDQLETIDASANTAGVSIDASASAETSPGLTITGTAEADTITGGDNGDTLTLGGGNDKVAYTAAGQSSIGTGTFDTITDFNANTVGSGANGAVGNGTTAAVNEDDWDGDVFVFNADIDTAVGGVRADVFASAAEATTFLANNAGSAEGLVAALDSSTGNLFVDNTDDGVADFFIQLQGVTTIDEAAFDLI